MINQEEVCIWFKNLEACSRIELMCALLDSCLPLELRFLGTYLEYSAGKHYPHLQKWEKEANKTISWFSSDDFSNNAFRQKFCLFLALLYSHNRTIAIKLFDVLEKWELSPLINLNNFDSQEEMVEIKNENSNTLEPELMLSDENKKDNAMDKSFYNEMKLLFSMACLHPAFDFLQRSKLRRKKDNLNSACPSTNVDNNHDDVLLIDEKEEISETVDIKPSIGRISAENLETTDLLKDLIPEVVTSTAENFTVSVVCAETRTCITATQSIDMMQSLASASGPLINIQQQPEIQQETRLTDVFTIHPPYLHNSNLLSQIVLPVQQLPQSTMPMESEVSIHGLIPVPCLLNPPPPNFIPSNISVHNNTILNNSPINNNPLNTFVPNEEVGPAVISPITSLSSPVLITQVKDSSMNETNVFPMKIPCHNLQLNIRPPFATPSQFCYTTASTTTTLPMRSIRSPSLDGSTIASLDGGKTCSSVASNSTIENQAIPPIFKTVTTSKTTGIVSSPFAPRRCLSESDAHDTFRVFREGQIIAGMNNKNAQMSKFSGTNSTRHVQFDNSVLNVSKNLGPYVQTNHHSGLMSKNSLQQLIVTPTYSDNGNINISNTLITNNNTTSPEVTSVSSPLQQQMQLQSLPPTPLQIQQPNNNTMIPNPIIYAVPISNTIIDPVATVQNVGYSYGKSTIPTGLNGTYIHVGHLPQKGNRRNNRIENGRKYDNYVSNVNELSVNIPTLKSSPIPVQQQQQQMRNLFPGLERLSQDTLESPFSSPSHSPRPSPFCSPAQSPIPQRKMINPKDLISETYATASSWLKSLRLHKYSDILENYTFEEMKHLDMDSLLSLGLQKGASNKLKQKINALVSRGFKEFGSADNLVNPELVHLTVSVSPASLSPISNRYQSQRPNDLMYQPYDESSELLNSVLPITLSKVSTSVSELPSSPPVTSPTSMLNHDQPDELSLQLGISEMKTVAALDVIQTKQLSQSENTYHNTGVEINSNNKQDKLFEDGLDYSDDEVFSSRKKSINATCYNCGHMGHYGDECTEQTMESQTYSRYAYQLDYSKSSEITSQEPTESTTNTNLNFTTENR